MRDRVRSVAPGLLLLGLLSGQVSTGLVVAHVATEHSATAVEHDHDVAGHHHAEDAAETSGGHAAQDDGPRHAHHMVPAMEGAPARTAGTSDTLEPVLPLAHAARFELASVRELAPPTDARRRAHPPEPKRHSVLLI